MFYSLLLASAPLLVHAAVAGTQCQKDLCYLEVEFLPLGGLKSECAAALAATVTTTITQTPSPAAISTPVVPSSIVQPVITTSSIVPTSFSNSTITVSSAAASSTVVAPTIITSCSLSSTVGADSITTSEYVGYPFIPWFSHWTTYTTLSDYTSVATLCATLTESVAAASLTPPPTSAPVLPSPSLPAASSCTTGVITKIMPGAPILETVAVPGRKHGLTITVPNPVPTHTVITTTNCNAVPSLTPHGHASPCVPEIEILTFATSIPTFIPFGGRAIGSFESLIESFYHVTRTLSACHGSVATPSSQAAPSLAPPSLSTSAPQPTPKVTTICHAHIALSTSLSTTTIKVPGLGPFIPGVTKTFTIPHIAPVTTTSCTTETLALEARFLHGATSLSHSLPVSIPVSIPHHVLPTTHELPVPTHSLSVPHVSIPLPTTHEVPVPTHSLSIPHVSIPVPTTHAVVVPTHIPGAGAINLPGANQQYGICGSQSKFASACACLGHAGVTVTVTATASAGN